MLLDIEVEMHPDIRKYNQAQAPADRAICRLAVAQVDTKTLRRWLAKARDIQWDYRNLIRRKGRLERLK